MITEAFGISKRTLSNNIQNYNEVASEIKSKRNLEDSDKKSPSKHSPSKQIDFYNNMLSAFDIKKNPMRDSA